MKVTGRTAVILLLLVVATNVRAGEAARDDDRLQQIMMQWPSRDYVALRARINEALSVYRAGGDRRREAIAYLFLSLVEISGGDLQGSRVHLREAVTRLDAVHDYVGAWLAFWMLAEQERLSEAQSDQTLGSYEECFRRLENARSSRAPFSIDAIMVVGPIVGLPPAEYEPDAANHEVDKPKVLHLLEVFTRDGYGAEFLRVGEFAKAEAQLQLAKKVAAAFGGRIDPPIDRHIGNLRQRQWRLDEARESYKTALEGLRVLRLVGTITPARLRVDIFGDLADLEMLNGRIDDALAWSDRALEIIRQAKSEDVEIRFLQRRAELLARAGRFAASERVFAEALRLAEKNAYSYLCVSLYLSRSEMNSERGRYGAAAADIEKALDSLSSANEPWREPAIWANVAMRYVMLGADRTARLALERARQSAEKNGRRLDVATIDLIEATRKFVDGESSSDELRNAVDQWSKTPDAMSVPGAEVFAPFITTLLGEARVDRFQSPRSGTLAPGTAELLQAAALFSQGRQMREARELALKALDVIRNLKHRASALALIGGTWIAEGEDNQAITYLKEASDALEAAAEDARVDPLLSTAVDGDWSSSTYDLLVMLLTKHGRSEEAFAVSERARARGFLEMLGNRRVTPRGENTLAAQEAETLRMEILHWEQQARVASTKQLDDDLREARRRYEALMTRVKASNTEYAAMTSVQPLQLEAIRAELPSNTTLINYFVAENQVHAWILDRSTLQYVRLPFDETDLARTQCAAMRLHVGGRGVRPVDVSCADATTEELYGKLFAPLRPHIRNTRLIIVPHSALHYLSFAAFRDPATKRYLIDDYTITYVPSASSIPFLRAKETRMKGNALVIGAPAGVSPELPGAMRETMFVGAALHSVAKIGASAKESLLYHLNGRVDIVHIAAHGFYDADAPLFSGIALAGGDGNDGNLEVHEILSDLDLRGVNLVVLSACETALGKSSAGDEVVGLTRALLYAGTPGVISTLWDVDDHAALALMRDFYRRFTSGDSAADALRHAQLHLLHGDFADPRLWAAFTLNGDPQGRWPKAGARK